MVNLMSLVNYSATLSVQIRKRGKDPKVKPILINKEDPSCVSDPSAVPDSAGTTATNHFEEMHPKDEFELMQSSLVTEKVSLDLRTLYVSAMLCALTCVVVD